MTDSALPAPLLAARSDKKRPVQLFQCAACNKNIADEAVPIAVRLSAFIVPQAARDRLDDSRVPFDITDVGLPHIVRELVDDRLHPDGHVYMGLGCFVEALQQQTYDAAGQVAPIAPRAALNAKGITNDAFTGREHRDPLPPAAPMPAMQAGDAFALLAAARDRALADGQTELAASISQQLSDGVAPPPASDAPPAPSTAPFVASETPPAP